MPDAQTAETRFVVNLFRNVSKPDKVWICKWSKCFRYGATRRFPLPASQFALTHLPSGDTSPQGVQHLS
jgi:hypothetical protein